MEDKSKMVQANMDDDVYKEVQQFIESHKVKYRSIAQFVSIACQEKLAREKGETNPDETTED